MESEAMSNVVDLEAARGAAEQPDPEFVRQDDAGRPLYLFHADYRLDGRVLTLEIWARDFDAAEREVIALRESLTLVGQFYHGEEPLGLERRLSECLRDCVDTTLLTVRDTLNDRDVELRLGSFDKGLSERAAELLVEAGL